MPGIFRSKYRELSEQEKQLSDNIKNKADELHALYSDIAPGRYNALAVTSLEQSVMWAIKQLTT